MRGGFEYATGGTSHGYSIYAGDAVKIEAAVAVAMVWAGRRDPDTQRRGLAWWVRGGHASDIRLVVSRRRPAWLPVGSKLSWFLERSNPDSAGYLPCSDTT